MYNDLKKLLIRDIEEKILTSKLDLLHFSYGYCLSSNISFRKVFKLVDELYRKYNLARA